MLTIRVNFEPVRGYDAWGVDVRAGGAWRRIGTVAAGELGYGVAFYPAGKGVSHYSRAGRAAAEQVAAREERGDRLEAATLVV